MVEDSPLASHWHCSALRSWTPVMWRLEERAGPDSNIKIYKNRRKRKSVSKYTHMGVCLSQFTREDGEKITSRSALYCNGWLYSHRKQGSEANGKPVTEAQFGSTFSNRVFLRNKLVTIRCNDGKRKFNLSRFERRQWEFFPMLVKALNRVLKWSGRRGRSALYCMQCNGCALTQREGAIFSMLVDEDERPLGAHRNQVSSTARS